MALTKISSSRREPFAGGRTTILETTLPAAGGGVQTEAHAGLIDYSQLDTPHIVSIVAIGVDGAVIDNNNPAAIANSDYQCRITYTDIETEVPATNTNVDGQILRIYIQGRAD
jgi:hypothetical protein